MARDPEKRRASQAAFGARRRAAAAAARTQGNQAAARSIWGHAQEGDPTVREARREVSAARPELGPAGRRFETPRSEGRELANFYHYKATRGPGQVGAPTNRDMLKLLRQGAAEGRKVEIFSTQTDGKGGGRPERYDAAELLEEIEDDWDGNVWDFVDNTSEYAETPAAAVYLVFAGGL